MKSNLFLFSAAALSLFAFTTGSHAETLTTQTVVTAKDLPHNTEMNFSVFDTNHDGAYSMPEVGEVLFKAFDTDGNENIDNIEWNKKTVLTIAPMDKTTFKFYDADDDGIPEAQTHTYETFYAASGLTKFDTNKDGLSAAEFINTGYEKLDTDENKMITLDEWKKAYMSSRPKHDEPSNYQK